MIILLVKINMLIIFVKGYSELRAKNKMCFSFFCLLTKVAFCGGESMNLCQVACRFSTPLGAEIVSKAHFTVITRSQ
jgi:hypothetical protein